MKGYVVAMQMVLASSEGRIFGLDAQLIHDAVLLGINIFIIFILASYLLFNPVRKLLKKRQDKIQGDLDAAAKDKEDASALVAEYEKKLAEINAQAEEILADARKKAKINEANIIAAAKEEAEVIKRRAEADIELEKKRALEDMKLEMIDIASVLAKSAVSAEMNVDIQESLVDEALNQMGDSTWQS